MIALGAQPQGKSLHAWFQRRESVEPAEILAGRGAAHWEEVLTKGYLRGAGRAMILAVRGLATIK
jgi:hypothetical protein